jgi:hypothetical protein
MNPEELRAELRAILESAINTPSATADRELLVQLHTEELVRTFGRYAHQLLDETLGDAHTRIDAKLSPDPVRQTIATVQTTLQDIWRGITGS